MVGRKAFSIYALLLSFLTPALLPANISGTTPQGLTPIEKITQGDLVWSWNQETGTPGYQPVLRTLKRNVHQILTITTGPTQIVTTPEHPFWENGTDWVEAQHLTPGDQLQTLAGDSLPITQITTTTQETPVPVYNFEVDQWHNYYVSDQSVLVHNGNRCFEFGGGDAIKAITAPTNRQALRIGMLRQSSPPSALKNPQAHHGLPWENREWFAQRGINVNDPQYGAWVEGGGNGGHQSWSSAYSDVWSSYIERNEKATVSQVLDFYNSIRSNSRWGGGF